MTHLVLIALIASGLLFITAILLRDALRKGRPTRDDYSLIEEEPLTPATPGRLLMHRIFAEDDLDFVTSEAAGPIRREFLQDRRRIAMSWLQFTRKEAMRILRRHLHAVRTNLSLNPLVELQLMAHTVLFFATYTLLWTIVATYGAFWARGFVRNAVVLTGKLSDLGSRILADADRSGLRPAASHGHV